MPERIFHVITPLQDFFSKVINGSVLLFVATFAAMVVANSPAADWYNGMLNYPIHFEIGHVSLFSHLGHDMTMLQFVNDALMAIFFFMIGLEIKREVLIGELSSFRKAALPVLAAIGGMVVPVLVYLLVCPSGPATAGAAIPMATDIAFALGVLALFGKRVPLGMKVFLMALAVVDDIGGIIVIAIFYSDFFELQPLLISAVLMAIIYIGGKMHIRKVLFYYVFGFFVWAMFLQSGLHPTIAGVLVGFMVPALPVFDTHKFSDDMKKAIDSFPVNGGQRGKHAMVLNNQQIVLLKHMKYTVRKTISPLQLIADNIEPFVSYVVLPLFAFVNAGVNFGEVSTSELMGVPLAVMCGLLIGKTVGIFTFSYTFVKFGWVRMPTGMNKQLLFGVSVLGGIGFTVSLFISNLSFSSVSDIGMKLLNEAKLGVFMGSLVSGVIGYFLLRFLLPKKVDALEPEAVYLSKEEDK